MKENTVLWCSLRPVFAPTQGKAKWIQDDPVTYGQKKGQLECHMNLPAIDSVCTPTLPAILPLVLNYKCRAAASFLWRAGD